MVESGKLLHDILQDPCSPWRNCQRYTASLVFHLTYGKRLSDDDRDLASINKILVNFIRDTYPGAHLVDAFPVLDLLPDFLAPWREEALQKHRSEKEVCKSIGITQFNLTAC
jgi:hypothetical protein